MRHCEAIGRGNLCDFCYNFTDCFALLAMTEKGEFSCRTIKLNEAS